MKRFIMPMLAVIILFMLCGCEGRINVNSTSTSTSVENEEIVIAGDDNRATLDGVTVTILGCEISEYNEIPIVYDRMGKITYNIRNDSDYPYGFSGFGWSCKVKGEYPFSPESNYLNMDLHMLEPGEEEIAEYYFIVEKDMEFAELVVEYLLINFDEEFWYIYNKPIDKGGSDDEYMSKYGKVPIFQFNIRVEE